MMTHPATFQQARVGWTERSEVQQPLASRLEFASLTPTYAGFILVNHR
jgi:hypothetical protein